MDMAKTKSILRMSDAKAMEFINLYEKEECLWNTRHARYKDHVERRRAAERVADSLEIPNFTYRHVQMKFKNLRNSYRQVLKKIARLDSRGILYTPTVFWFQTLDSFIKPHMHERRAAEEDHPTSEYEDQDVEECLQVNLSKEKATNSIIIEETYKNDAPNILRKRRKLSIKPKLDSEGIKLRKMGISRFDPTAQTGVTISKLQYLKTEEEHAKEISNFNKKLRNVKDSQIAIKESIKALSSKTEDENAKKLDLITEKLAIIEDHQKTIMSSKITKYLKNEDENYKKINVIANKLTNVEENQKTICQSVKGLATDVRNVSNINDDYFDNFGKYVADLLKALPLDKAMAVKPQIVSLILKGGLNDLLNEEKAKQNVIYVDVKVEQIID